MPEQTLIIGAEGRPCQGEIVSGDGWAIDWDGPACRVAVIDGLGHGPQAAKATEAAISVLSTHPTLPPDEVLRRCHLALRGTRGAAISIAHIDPPAGKLLFAGVGNVEGRLWIDGLQSRLVAYRGIVGATLPTIRTFEYDLSDEWTLLLHTDGISARFGDIEMPESAQNEPRELARLLLRDWSRPQDDATALVVQPRLT